VPTHRGHECCCALVADAPRAHLRTRQGHSHPSATKKCVKRLQSWELLRLICGSDQEGASKRALYIYISYTYTCVYVCVPCRCSMAVP
jgi:hypothetical protein